MYRFIALKKGLKFIFNCITRALILSIVLYLLGFPKEFIFLEGYTKDPKEKKQTHWDLSCINPVDKSFQLILTPPQSLVAQNLLFQRNMFTTETFATYTRDLINYYQNQLLNLRKRGVRDFKVLNPQLNNRYKFLEYFKELFDRQFPEAYEIVKSPVLKQSKADKFYSSSQYVSPKM
jgi:hypothetical protein